MALLDELQKLVGGGSVDLGGAPGGDNSARALSQLIMGGGSASVEGTPIIGNPPPEDAALATAMRQAEMGGFGRAPNPALVEALRSGQVDPNAVLNRPVSPGDYPGTITGIPAMRDVSDAQLLQQAQAPGTFQSARNIVPLRPGFQQVVDTAKAVADSLSPRPSQQPSTTLLPNPYGPGSYNPNDPEDVARVKKEGEAFSKTAELRQILSSGILSQLPPGAPTGEIVKALFENAGIIKSETQKARELAQAKAEGERAGGKGQRGLTPDITRTAGTPEFAEAFANAVARGELKTPAEMVAAESLHDRRIKEARPSEKAALSYQNAEASLRRLDRLGNFYNEATKGGESLSQNLKLQLGKNTTWAAFLQNKLIPVSDKLTDAEQAFVAEANSLLIGMRQLYDDNRMSDQDVRNALQALGSPLTGKGLYNKQLDAVKNVVRERAQAILRGEQARGKDVSGLTSEAPAAPKSGGGWATSPSGIRYRIKE